MTKNKKIIFTLFLGILLGTFSSIGDILPFGSTFFIIGGFLNTASVWTLSSFLIGTRFKSRKDSVVISISFLILSILSYYTFGYLFGDRGEVPISTLLFAALSWIVISLFVGALCGLAGRSAKYSKDIKKRIIAVIIPMVIIGTESVISILQILPYLNSNSNNYIPFGVLISLTLSALTIPFFIFNNKRIALYTMVLGVIVSLVGILFLVGLSRV